MTQYLGTRTGPNDLTTQGDAQGPAADILSAVTGGSASTADFELASLTIPAGFLTATGMTFLAEQFSAFTKATGAMNLVLWVKVNSVKVAAITLAQANAAQSAQPVHHRNLIVVRSLGPTGVIAVAGQATKGTTAQVGGASGTVTVDTSAAVTISIGANMSVANAGHSLTAQVAKVGML